MLAAMSRWLMKSEFAECSVDNALAAPNATVPWVDVQVLRKRRNSAQA